MKRTIKKQLKEDEFITDVNKFWEFARKWQKEIMIAAAALGGVALIFFGFQLLKSQQINRDSRELGRILEIRTSLAKNPQDVAKLEQAAAKGKYARVAALGLVTHWIEQGQLDKAQAALALIKDAPKDFMYYQARDLAAQVAILKGDYDAADRHPQEGRGRKAQGLHPRRGPVPSRRSPGEEGKRRRGARDLQEAPGGIRAVLLRIRRFAPGPEARSGEMIRGL